MEPTAPGYPIRSANMVVEMIEVFEPRNSEEGNSYHLDSISLLVEPYGGSLVHREAQAADLEGLEGLPTIAARETSLLDCEQIALGTYSPLKGFMN